MSQGTKGYIKLYRDLQDCWVWFDDSKFTKGQAWVDLLMLANHKDKKMSFKDEIITIKRGQYVTSIKKLADRWNWSFNTVKKFLDLLESDNMLTRKSDNKKTLLTIVNYEIYQGDDDSIKDVLDSQADSQADRHFFIGEGDFNKKADRQTDRQTDKQKASDYKGLEGRADKHIDRQTDSQVDSPAANKLTPNKKEKNDKEYNNNIYVGKSECEKICNLYNEICKSLPRCTKLSDKRLKILKVRLKNYSVKDFENVFTKAENSDFLSGRNGSWNGCGFDWLIIESNMIKVLEGNYDNKQKKLNTEMIQHNNIDKLKALEDRYMRGDE